MFRKGKKRHSSSSSQSSEISTKSKSVDSSLGGLSRSSTVASLDTDSTKSSGQSNNSDTCAEFRIRYVGAIEKLKLSEGKGLDGPLDLINYIDVAQVKTKIVPVYKILQSKLMALEKDVACPRAWLHHGYHVTDAVVGDGGTGVLDHGRLEQTPLFLTSRTFYFLWGRRTSVFQ